MFEKFLVGGRDTTASGEGAGSADLRLVLGMQIKLEVLSRLGPCVCISWAHCSCLQLQPN